MNLQIIDPTQYQNWDNLLLSAPGGTFFHSSSWAKVLKDSYGYSPCYFTLIDNGRLSALIPVMEVNSLLTGKRGVSLPFTDYCDPIVDEGIDFQEVFKQIIEFGKRRGWKYIELRGGSGLVFERSTRNPKPGTPSDSLTRNESLGSFPDFRNLISDTRFDTRSSETYLGHTLNLSRNEENIFSGFRDSTKRSIKKAMKEGVEVKINNSIESIKGFYRLNCMTRKEHGLPPQPYSFFRRIHDHILSKNLGFLILASYGQKAIAGAVYFHFGNKAVYKYGASEIGYQHLRANNLVMWEGIRWSCKKGHKSLCIGRTDAQNKGLIQFKSGWGATEQEINYYRYDFKKEAFVSGSSRVTGFHNKIFRNIPIPILTKIGALIYKHVG